VEAINGTFKTNGTFVIRVLDVYIGILLLFTSFPFWIVIGVLIKLTSRGPIFYIQERLREYKRPFKLVKFRTMVVKAEENGPIWANMNDSRITPFGRFLRKTRLDELPQLINVLKGDLSIVGPRPVIRASAELLSQHDVNYDKRFLVKPGITGWSQINWSHTPFIGGQLEKLQYDLRYLSGFSIKDYFKIILLTVKTMMMGNGV
jgi:lipopolysaccharide/colanic/teichoic acid biosynthesis glycosyltransferase